MSTERPLRIAIIGGGIGGATLMNALLPHRHLHVEIFESAPEFSERGAAVGIAKNGQAALAEIGGDVATVLERARAVYMSSSRVCMASGPNAMSIVFDLASEHGGMVVHRAALLSELLKPIDKEKMQTSKKLVRIEDRERGSFLLHFQDGTTFDADAVIGADGVRGYVREYVIGKDHPAVKAKRAGFWDTRALVPIQKARELLGGEYFLEGEQRQYGWIGNGGFFMHDILDGGETVQFVLCGVIDEEWTEEEWSKPMGRQELEKAVESWTDTPIKKGSIEAMLENPDLKAFAESHHEENAPTYTKGRVCIMGDSAHCATPWQGSGAGQAIEDAMILETVLKEVTSPAQLDAAFKAYDRVRRPRTQHIVASSYGTGLIMCGRGQDTGLDLDKIREALPKRWVFIHGQDQKEHKLEALVAMKAAV